MGALQTAGGQESELRLGDYLAILRRRWLIVVVFIALAVAAAAIFSARTTPQYRSSVRVLVTADLSSTFFDQQSTSVQVIERQLENEIEFAQSDVVREEANKKYGSPVVVSVTPSDTADILTITATDRVADAAAAKANVYARTYVEQKAATAGGSYEEVIQILDDRLAELAAEELALIDGGETQNSPRVQAIRNEQAQLQSNKAEFELREDIAASNARITRLARTASSPYEPNWQRNLLLGAAAGLVVGLAGAFAREGMDDRIQSRRDLEHALPTLPLLGALPPPETELGVHVAHARSGLFLESARALRSSLQFIIGDAEARSVAITSPNAAEGKSTTSVTLAFLAARTGQRVLLIDADLRRPKLAEGLGLDPNESGLREYLSYGDTVVLQEAWVAGEEPVAFLGPGTDGTAVSADLFVAERWPTLIQEMEEKFDLIIVDTSPVLPVTDGVLASAGCAMTVIVARRDNTTSAQLTTALTSLERARCVMAGSVLSDARSERSYGYSGGYYRP
ncbi:MAG: Wzz/FepE/Etk N-terminal domain-containing protein [Acidimicrobiales bacterium]